MAEYQFRAKDINGKKVRGQLQAGDEQKVYDEVKTSGLFAVSIKLLPEKVRTRPLKSRHLADFSKQISVMLESGITLTQAFNILVQREHDPKLAGLYRDVYHLLLQGYLLSQALEQKGELFPPLLVNMVRAGEEGGQLTTVMQELTSYYENDYRMRKKIEGAMIYPAFLGVIIIASLVLLLTTVLPSFYQLFDGKVELTAATKLLIWISNQLRGHGFLIVMVLAMAVVLILYLSQNTAIRFHTSRILLKTPMIGSLCKSIYTARFARTLSALYGQGISLIQGFRLTIDVMGNCFLKRQLKALLQDLCDGVPLSTVISGMDGLNDRLADSIFIGEETGELQSLLEHVADSLDVEAEEALKQLLTLIEPVMIVLMAVVVGFIMFSVMTPLMQYYGTLG